MSMALGGGIAAKGLLVCPRQSGGAEQAVSVRALNRMDIRPIRVVPGAVPVFFCAQNERQRLYHFLEHHRRIGAGPFFAIDNGSADGTMEHLLAQPDCHVFSIRESYAAAGFGISWLNELRDIYARDRWCLSVDVDEAFVYPGCESASLSDFTRHLDEMGAEGVVALMLDMYSERAIADTIARPDQSPIDLCPHFDRHYEWRERPRIPFRPAAFPSPVFHGGPRLRCFYPEFKDTGSLHLELIMRIAARLRFLGLPVPGYLATPPWLSKIPLVRWTSNARYVNSHSTVPVRLADTTGIIQHFKFLADFHERALAQLRKGQSYDPFSEHARYVAVAERDPAIKLYYEGSERYGDSAQLVDLGLMKESPEWRAARAGCGVVTEQCRSRA